MLTPNRVKVKSSGEIGVILSKKGHLVNIGRFENPDIQARWIGRDKVVDCIKVYNCLKCDYRNVEVEINKYSAGLARDKDGVVYMWVEPERSKFEGWIIKRDIKKFVPGNDVHENIEV